MGIRNRKIIESVKNKFMIVKGHVQSGKTHFMICCSLIFIYNKYSVVILLRNKKADHEQIKKRIYNIKKDICEKYKQDNFNIVENGKKLNDKNIAKSNNIYIVLCNDNSINKINKHLHKFSKKYILFIDEVDYNQ